MQWDVYRPAFVQVGGGGTWEYEDQLVNGKRSKADTYQSPAVR